MFLQLIWQLICLILRAACLSWNSVSRALLIPAVTTGFTGVMLGWTDHVSYLVLVIDFSQWPCFFLPVSLPRKRAFIVVSSICCSSAFDWLRSEGKYGTRQRYCWYLQAASSLQAPKRMQTEEHFQAYFERKLSSTFGGALQIPRENRQLQCRWVLCQEFIRSKETKETLHAQV